MHRYFLQISYNGTAYHGWQIQNNATTVQQVLNTKLSVILQEEIQAIGAGRTDTGVHAEYFMAHFDVEKTISDSALFIDKINKVLPKDIAVYQLFNVHKEANTRFDAVSRTYEYRITHKKNPFLTNLAWNYRVSLNLDLMNQAAKILFEFQDFTSFSKTGTQVKTNNCKIYEANWFKTDDSLLVFKIKADRFLRNMVRAITGTLMDVGLKKLSVDDFRKIIESKNRSNAGFSVPAHGLFLTGIEYPEGMFITERHSE
ncbi:MAG: tRNA pseudouridine(38-40) synthase TruA [Bacteroidetes bacterium]|nr:MAG: tRNA pseudouridine(38-40) synthase TruA [Bacteroidota bacterium]